MAWAEQWSHTVDGVQINDRVNFFAMVPELDNGFRGDVILVDVAGDVPWYVRVQPKAGLFTYLIQMTPCAAAVYAARLATLKALFTPGPHTYVVQARGQAAPKTYTIICDGGYEIAYESRRFTAVATVLQQV